MKHAVAANRLLLLATGPAAILCAVLGAGCQSNGTVGSGQPDVIQPNAGATPTTRSTAAAGAAANPAAPGTAGGTVASINGAVVPRSQLDALLYSAYGLDALMKLVQLDMARAEAGNKGLTVSPADVAAELKLTMKQLAPTRTSRTTTRC